MYDFMLIDTVLTNFPHDGQFYMEIFPFQTGQDVLGRYSLKLSIRRGGQDTIWWQNIPPTSEKTNCMKAIYLRR